MITIRHTHAEGTLVEGSVKGDGVWEVLKGTGRNWRYSRNVGLYLGQSRDRAANGHVIGQAAEALRVAGHEVSVEVDEGERRSVAEIEADRAERAEARTERYEERSERVGEQASADYAKARQMGEAIPFGQPILVDHYSARSDRNYRNRMSRTYERAFEGMDEAKELARRAESAQATQSHRESIPATLRRIAKLEADLRGVQRHLAGRMDYVDDGQGGYSLKLVKPGERWAAQLERRAADLAEQLAYWRGHVAAAEAEGVKVWTKADFAKGDFVRTRYGWAEVLRVNAKSVSIPWNVNHTGDVIRRSDGHYPRPWPYDEVRGRKSADEIAEMFAAS